MRFRIHGTYPKNGAEDTVVVEGDSIEEIKVLANKEVSKRGWTDTWSEEIKETD